MKEIEKLDITGLKALLSELKEYKDMTKKIGERWRKLFHRKLNKTSLYTVEYFPSLSENEIYKTALEVYKKVFNIEPKREEIVFKEKESLLWGMKVFKDDAMVDMSFSKVEKLLKK